MRNDRLTACFRVFWLSVVLSAVWVSDTKADHGKKNDTDTTADSDTEKDCEDAGVSDDAGVSGDAGCDIGDTDSDTGGSGGKKDKDKDKDGIPDDEDNCPEVANPDQEISACAEDSYLGGAFSCDCGIAPGRSRIGVTLLILFAFAVFSTAFRKRRF